MLPGELPLISVVTVVRNGASYIESTIQSVLSQTYGSIDLVIVDGNSSDATMQIVKKFEGRLRWISEPDKGIYDAMNKGIGLAKGVWINFLNGGDTYFGKNTLTSLFEAVVPGKTRFLYGDSINISGEKTKYIPASSVSADSVRRDMGLCHQAVFVKKEFCPMYDLDYHYKAEYNWIIEILQNMSPENIVHVKIPVVYYALGGFSEKGGWKNLREFVRLTRKRFGWKQVLLNLPVYYIVFARFVKNSIVKH